jgi:Zn-dependent M28 family amino/carboxypeptidase
MSVHAVSLAAGAVLAALAAMAAAPALHDAFDSAQAYAYTKQVVAFGERWPGSPGHQKTEDLIHAVLARTGATVVADNFTAKAPQRPSTFPGGPIEVHNIIGKFNVTSDPQQEIVILGGHYDTLFKKGFVGANDGGSSTAILLAIADALAHQKTRMQVWLMWTDLEEAIEAFQGDDGLYGSRHFAQKLKADGLVPRVKGFFLLDMIGDTDLGVARETSNSDAGLQLIMARAANDLGYQKYFFQYESAIIDDHQSFHDVGIPSVDVVDAEFGRMGPDYDGMGEFHHSNADTMDKVSARSLEIVGRTILKTVELMDASGSGPARHKPGLTP